jgi:formylglycine-generating enzyme required for sulfatase activity
MTVLVSTLAIGALVVLGLAWMFGDNRSTLPAASVAPSGSVSPDQLVLPSRGGMIGLPAGRFQMGSDATDLPDARPVHTVRVGGFRLDARHVTNRQFAAFIDATGYLTTAEQTGWSHVFDREPRAWQKVAGADWRHPAGPNSSIAGRDTCPVVQVSWFDAAAYAKWAGKRLPTEAEHEYAARAGLADAVFPWGSEERPEGNYLANYWQGRFAYEDLGRDGFRGLAPVAAFPPNRFGLYDMAGNVWSWCSDWYADDAYLRSPVANPSGPERGDERVLRGGSWQSAKNFRFGIRTAARWQAIPGYRSNHVGFRCAKNE